MREPQLVCTRCRATFRPGRVLVGYEGERGMREPDPFTARAMMRAVAKELGWTDGASGRLCPDCSPA